MIVSEVRRTMPQIEEQPVQGPEEFVPDPDYAGLDDGEVAALAEKTATELRRRQVLRGAAEAVEQAAVTYLAAAGVHDGDPWVRPVAVGYPVDARATHDGRLWVNRVPNNFHEPGVSGWRAEPTGGEVPPFIKPVSPFDAYEYGEQVTHDGKVFRSIFDLGDGLNYWSPGEMPEYWELVNAPEPDPEPDPDPGSGGDVPVWERPVWAGAEGGAYALGERVRFPDAEGPVYRSTHDGWNTWAPDEFGWVLDS